MQADKYIYTFIHIIDMNAYIYVYVCLHISTHNYTDIHIDVCIHTYFLWRFLIYYFHFSIIQLCYTYFCDVSM